MLTHCVRARTVAAALWATTNRKMIKGLSSRSPTVIDLGALTSQAYLYTVTTRPRPMVLQLQMRRSSGEPHSIRASPVRKRDVRHDLDSFSPCLRNTDSNNCQNLDGVMYVGSQDEGPRFLQRSLSDIRTLLLLELQIVATSTARAGFWEPQLVLLNLRR